MFLRLRHSLIQRAYLLFGAVTLLLIVEVVLGVRMQRDSEAEAENLANIYRRAQVLIIAASNINDFVFDLNFRDRIDMGLPETLAHWHTRLVKMMPIAIEARRLGHTLPEPSLEQLTTLSTQLQHSPSPDAIEGFVRDTLTVAESLASEVLTLLVGLENSRNEQARRVESTHRRYTLMMLAAGVAVALLITVASWQFLINLIRGLRALGDKAVLIACGDDFGQPLPTGREDELGEVMRAVNIMAQRLVDRDRQIDELRLRFGQQEKMMALGTFAAGMAHEIGNPIQAITALCYHLREQVVEDGDRDEEGEKRREAILYTVDTISSNAERLARTVAEVREYAYPNRPEKEPVDLNDLVRRTVALMSYDPRLKRHAVEVRCEAQDSVVNAVSDHLVQVLLNLLINAADAMEGRPGAIRISTEDRPAGSVAVAVADSGVGMSAEVLRRAFEPFFTTKPHNRGTGLGLAICRSIADEHDVTIGVTSEPNVGTTVLLEIPRG
ncbi:MAG: ATP-binding protein [Alphaproteobacteria bacterium]